MAGIVYIERSVSNLIKDISEICTAKQADTLREDLTYVLAMYGISKI